MSTNNRDVDVGVKSIRDQSTPPSSRNGRGVRIAAGLAAAVIAGAAVAYAVKRRNRATRARLSQHGHSHCGSCSDGDCNRQKNQNLDNVAAEAESDAAAVSAHEEFLDDYPINMGHLSVPVDTQSATAQRWFDRGINWTANFHREEAAFCFRKASEADPQCAMAFWGLAFVNGPDYNFHLGTGFYDLAKQPTGYPSLHVANAAASTAHALASSQQWRGKPAHRALIGALTRRYEWPVTPSTPDLQRAYRAAMTVVAARFPDDALVAAVQAEAVMNLAPWLLYDTRSDFDPASGPPGSGRALNKYGLEAKEALDRGLASAPDDVWLAHLKVHFNEMGPVKDFDWETANLLRNARVTGNYELGHLLHMPTHLDIQVGDYSAAMEWNIKAWKADLKLFEYAPERFTIYIGYLIHNMEFCAWAAMYGGNYSTAMMAAENMEKFVTDALIASSERVASVLELYRTTRIMVMIRFGRWDDILNTAFREDRRLFCGHTLFLHYARGIAYGAKGLLDEAEAEQRAFEQLRATFHPEDRVKHNVHLVDMGGVASAILDAEVKYRADDLQGPRGAFASARLAVRRFDALPYDEPHGWLMSPRQTLGALLTEKGEFKEAADVYRQDLHLFPRNIWSLTGLRRCLGMSIEEALVNVSDGGSSGHDQLKAELQKVEDELVAARRVADIEVGASCACALSHWDEGNGAGTARKVCCQSTRTDDQESTEDNARRSSFM